MTKIPNCYEALRELDSAMRVMFPEGQDYFVVGGIATAALRSDETVIDSTTNTIHAAKGSADSTIRDNGTKRDVDVLIPKLLGDTEGAEIREVLADAIDDQLDVSVFGFDQYKQPPVGLKRAGKLFSGWSSRRTIDENGVVRYSMYPLEQAVQPESFEPWRLVTAEGTEMSVFHPVGHVLAYHMRSISGLRHKDKAKVTDMAGRVYQAPGMVEAMLDGPFKEWRTFADVIERLKHGQLDTEHPVVQPGVGTKELAIYGLKSRLLAQGESSDLVVNFFQKGSIQEKLKRINGNK